MELPQDLLEALRKKKRIVVLSGAGVSKESGIPTFREAQTGLWAKYNPTELATPQAFQRNPRLVWQWYRWRRGLISQAVPNPGHFALVDMEARIQDFVLITQNVDGFHHRAGNKNIIELHGNIFRNKCYEEGLVLDLVEEFSDKLPRCPNCGGYIRPDVVWFGESLPNDSLTRAKKAAQAAEVFLSVGTSALIQPAASLPLIALDNSAVVVEINTDVTQITEQVHFSLQGPSGEILPRLVDLVWESHEKGMKL
jgi:NAD-dependent deacetylase